MNFGWSEISLILRLILDILCVWALVYAGIQIVRNNNRTIQIVKGILVLFIVRLVAMWLNLKSLNYLLDTFLNWSVILVLIVLQPEIRSMLEKMGKTSTTYNANIPAARVNTMINELVKAVDDMSRTKTGALISIQMAQDMEDYEDTGIPMDSDVTSELLETIFQYGTPMHDGAVIIKGDKLAAAAAYFPSTSKDLPSKYGARHRAAVGISEVTDSITLVVSEETGNISIAQRGTLTQTNPEALQRFLTNKLIPTEAQGQGSMLTPVINTARNFSSSFNRNRQQQRNQDDRVKAVEIVDLRENTRPEPASKTESGHKIPGHNVVQKGDRSNG